MKQRGRKSLAALTANPVEAVKRVPPPICLTEEQAAEWVRVVNSMPAAHFQPVNELLLEQYCKHAVVCRYLGYGIEQAQEQLKNPPSDLELRVILEKSLYDLLGQQREESKIVVVLMRQMRMTQQSIYRKETTYQDRPNRTKPWDRAA